MDLHVHFQEMDLFPGEKVGLRAAEPQPTTASVLFFLMCLNDLNVIYFRIVHYSNICFDAYK